MRTKKRKLTAILLVLAMLFTLMPALPQVAEAAEASGKGYVTLNYENDGLLDRKITVNVILDGNQVDTFSVNDAKASMNNISLTVVDSSNYEIAGWEGVSYSTDTGANFSTTINETLQSWSGIWEATANNNLVITINLRTKTLHPDIINGVYVDVNTIEFRAYEPEILKMLYLEGVSIPENGDLDIDKITYNFYESISGYGDSESTTGTPTLGNNEADYHYATLSNASHMASPMNVKSITIEYEGGSKEISADKLQFVYHDETLPYYSIESNNNQTHVVYFYNQHNAQTHYTPYAVRFVKDGESLENNMPSEPDYGDANTYIFVNWEIGNTGEPFFSNTVVNDDLTIFAQKVTSAGSAGTEIHVDNTDNELIARIVEVYNAENNASITAQNIDKSSIKMSVGESSGKATNPDYWNNKWFTYSGDEYYRIWNLDAPVGIPSLTNDHVAYNDLSSVTVYFQLNNIQGDQTVTIPIGQNPGEISKSMVDDDAIIRLAVINAPNAPTKDEMEKNIISDGNIAVECVTKADHSTSSYALLSNSYSIGNVEWRGSYNNNDGAYYIDIVVNNEKYVEAYNKENEGHSIDGDATKTITLRWENNAWKPVTNLPVTFTVKCDDPTPATYSLKYDANGGSFGGGTASPAEVSGLLAGTYTLWAKDQSVTDDKQPDDETAWPTHAKNNDTEVVMIGWTAEEDTKIYAKGDQKPNVIPTATITDDDVTVYAVWGYDTNGNGTPDVEENWYTLTYNANGGNSDSVPVDSNTHAKDEEVTLSSQVPTHPQEDGKDVVFIGWSTEERPIYEAGENYKEEGFISDNKVTFDNDDIIVYAVWGYDEYGKGPEGGDGTADAEQVVIIPADITVYTGGTGYTGVLNGDEMTSTDNGLPEPGYYFILPYELNEQINEKDGTIADLSDKLKLTCQNGDDSREWTLNQYNEETPIMVGGRYIYRLTESGENQQPARLEIHDNSTNPSTNIVSDQFEGFGLDSLYKDYTMNLYTNNNTVNVQTNNNGTWENVTSIKGIALGVGKLTVRGTTDQDGNLTSGIQNSVSGEVSSITAATEDEVTYYTNGSKIEVVDPDKVQLLVDEIVSTAQDDLKEAIVQKAAGNESINITDDYTFDFNYLDLVDTSNGNAYVTMGDGQEMTLFWPYPEGFDETDTFYIAHFNGLDRNYDDLETALESANIDLYSEDSNTYKLDKTENGIKITVNSFSPFALVYDADQGSGGNTGGGGSTGGGTTPNPPALNTEDHFSYVVGYEDGMVKPENAITRAEVASIFYRLLKDDVRDANTTDVSEFSDVSASDWYGTTVATLSAMDIVRGYEDGTFRPNAPITRAEFAAIATRFFEETGAEYEPGTFDDVTGNEWFANAIADAVELGLIGGYPDGTVRPNNNITRAEACAIVNRTLGRIPHVDHLLPADEMTTWPDNNPSDWFYADMQEATNGHEYEWTTEDGQKVEEWTEILDKDWEDR